MRKALLAILFTLGCTQAGAMVTVLAPVNIIDMLTGATLTDRAVTIEDGRITGITAAGLAETAHAEVIDGRGGWLIPGLAEMHAHVPSSDSGEQYARDVLSLFLANGVTTIRGMLGEPWHLELRDDLASGVLQGPRLITSGPSFNGRSVSSPEQGAQRVRNQAAAGYDFLKIHPGLSREEFQAIAATANELGIPFGGHISFATGLDTALAAGQATIDHLDAYAEAMVPADSDLAGIEPRWFGLNLGAAMDPGAAGSLARATADAGVWVVPTQSLFEHTAGDTDIAELESRPGMSFLSPDLSSRWRGAVENFRSEYSEEQRGGFLRARHALILALQEAGAGILLGSDAPQIMNVPGFSVHQELAFMVDAGLTPLQALQSGTIQVARFFEFTDQGQVAPGFVADLVLLEDNPLENIANTTSILGVARAGRWYPRATLDQMLQGIEARGL